ncbi:MAG: hypothetical protein ABSG43_02845 [Solirubrobacteraceae bacterium]
MIELGEIAERGQKFEVTTTRTLVDAFRERREEVFIGIGRPTDELLMRVVWPSGRPPIKVGLKINGQLQDLTGSLQSAGNGRKKVEWRTAEPKVDDEYVITWDAR